MLLVCNLFVVLLAGLAEGFQVIASDWFLLVLEFAPVVCIAAAQIDGHGGHVDSLSARCGWAMRQDWHLFSS